MREAYFSADPAGAPHRRIGATLLAHWRQLWATLLRTGRLMCGIPDYQGYVDHMRAHHPDQAPPTYEEFFRRRLDARYGRGAPGRCC